MRLVLCLLLGLALSVLAEEVKKAEVTLKAGAEANYDFSFLPETVARYGDEKMSAAQLLRLMKGQLSAFEGRMLNQLELKKMAAHFIISHYEHKAALAIAARYGLRPAFGLADLKFQVMEKELGKAEVMKKYAGLGLPYSQLPAFLAELDVIQEWVDKEIAPQAEIGEIEALVFYRKHKEKFEEPQSIRFAEIFVGFTGMEKRNKAKDKIGEVERQLNAGGGFADIARKYSEARSAENGGELKVFVDRQNLLPEFHLLFELQENHISQVVETESGFYIFRLLEKKEAYTPEFNEIKDELLRRLVNERARAIKDLTIQNFLQNQGFEVFIK